MIKLLKIKYQRKYLWKIYDVYSRVIPGNIETKLLLKYYNLENGRGKW